MTTDPGDLVLDPTCGSGTTAFVAEKWGRRWITCDTSRVAITLAKQRLMTASFDYYALRYPHEGLKGGFDYETVPHVTLKSIVNNAGPDIDTIYAEDHPKIDAALGTLNAALKGQRLAHRPAAGKRKGTLVPVAELGATSDLVLEEVPSAFPDHWPEAARDPHRAVQRAKKGGDIAGAMERLNRSLDGAPLRWRAPQGGRKGVWIDFCAADGATVALPSGEMAPANALLEWEVPFDFPDHWPDEARAAFDAFHAARQAMQRRMDQSIADHAEQETLYDKPRKDETRLRVTGPFSVEAVPAPTVLSLDETTPPAEADETVARSGETSRQAMWRDELLKTGVRAKGGAMLRFAEFETLPSCRFLHASGSLADTGERVVVSFGPEHAALEQRQVEEAMEEAYKLLPRPKFILFCAFAFDPEAAKDIDEMNVAGMTFLKAQMNTDLLTEDLRKKRASNQSFWLMGQPDVDLRKRPDGLWEVEVNGFDYFDPKKGDVESGGKSQIAMWALDTDYDQRSLMPRQVFFPMADDKGGWNRLKLTVRAELDEELLEQFHGTVSLPFEAGESRRIAVKIVDDRGIESLKIMTLEG
jgi:adenine-specific DNA-methyltransferase